MERFHALVTQDLARLDRIPIDYWASPEIDSRLCTYYGLPPADKQALLDYLDVDFRYIPGPRYIGPPLQTHPDGSENDIWGVPRRRVYFGDGEFRGSYENVVRSPLADAQSVTDVTDYPLWPDPDWYDYSVIPDQCDAVHAKGRVVMFMGDRLNRIAQLKPMMYLRGVERTLADLARPKSPIFDAIVDRLRTFYTEYLKRILTAANGKIDIIVTGDDFGQQDGLLCSPRTWRSKLLPGFRTFIQTVKAFSKNIAIMHHTCGSVVPIIPDMIEAGLDILNPVQPGTADMDPKTLKTQFGDRLLFHGGISLQGPLRFGTPPEIAAEVKVACETWGKNGGYILCTAHNLNADLRTENIDALFMAYHAHAGYSNQQNN
jgi:uroporphyrinogen decarboxylase